MCHRPLARRLALHVALLLSLGTAACGDESSTRGEDTGMDVGGDVADVAEDSVDDTGDSSDAGDTAADADTEDAAPLPPLGAVFDRCGEGAPSPACFAQRRDPDSKLVGLAHAIARKVVDTTDPRTLPWDWGEAVMLFGMTRVAAVTGDGQLLDFVAEYVDHHIDTGYTIATSDTSAPAALAVALVRAGRDEPRYRDVIGDALAYYADEAERTPDGGISHFGTLELFGAELWADSLFMFGNVMTPWGAWGQDIPLLDTYAEQVTIFADALQDESGLFRHAAWSSFTQEPDIYWARANGWVLAAVGEHAAARIAYDLPVDDVRRVTHRLGEALVPLQDEETGLWWTVLNRPGETYLETSASALFAYGFARAWRYGMAGDDALEVVERAMDGVLSRITFDAARRPVVTGISGPTSVGGFDYYAGIPQGDDISFGVGAVLLALTEVSGLDVELGVPSPSLEPVDAPEGTTVPMEASDAFELRRAEYLSHCADNNGPGSGGIYGQSCRVAEGLSVNETAIDGAVAHVNERRDVADFRANALVRLLYLDDDTEALPDDVRGEIEDALLGFKYWIDEPGTDQMAYWTENHQILFHTAELLMGQRHKETVFENSGMTGAEHMEHAHGRIERWLEYRGRYGFSEWHSSVYFNEDLPALLNIVDFAEDADLRHRAAMVLDVMAIDLATNMFDGAFATTAGRIYRSKFIGGENDSTRDYAWIALGLGEYRSADNFAAAFLATSDYVIPPLLETLAQDVAPALEHRQRDSWDIEERDAVGVTTEGLDDTVVWAGLSAIVAPEIIDGSMAVVDEYDLWDGFLFGSLPSSVLDLIRGLVGTPGLRGLAEDLLPLSRGMALEGTDTYIYRTPEYQMAAAQDWKPGMWAAQTLMFRASIGRDATVTLNVPTALGLAAPGGVTIDDPWVGGWLPRVTAHRNVAVVQFHRPQYAPAVDSVIQGDIVHAYFPTEFFDEWEQRGSWWFAREGDGYLALWTEKEAAFAEESTHELVVESLDNVFIVELGSADEHGSFEAFMDGLEEASVTLDPFAYGGQRVRYASPSVGDVEVGWRGPMTVDGDAVDLGPYQRFDSEAVVQAHGTDRLVVTTTEGAFVLDFATDRREMLSLD
jgi:rhamnogalacturonyl hydrolase YesR